MHFIPDPKQVVHLADVKRLIKVKTRRHQSEIPNDPCEQAPDKERHIKDSIVWF